VFLLSCYAYSHCMILKATAIMCCIWISTVKTKQLKQSQVIYCDLFISYWVQLKTVSLILNTVRNWCKKFYVLMCKTVNRFSRYKIAIDCMLTDVGFVRFLCIVSYCKSLIYVNWCWCEFCEMHITHAAAHYSHFYISDCSHFVLVVVVCMLHTSYCYSFSSVCCIIVGVLSW